MLKELFTAALGMQNQQTRLEVTTNNMANASTAGFKRASVFERNLIDAKANFFNTPGDVEQNDSPIGSYYSQEPGAYTMSGNKLDVAIEGKGFFVVEDSENKKYLTRAGNFQLSTEGYIVTKDGHSLLGQNGPINLSEEFLSNSLVTNDKTAVNIRISENGEVFANDMEVGKILVANVQDDNTLQRVSGSNFFPTWESDVMYLQDEDFNIRQGWVEGSNVNIVQEMVTMIELQRTFEAGSKVIQTNDGTLERAIGLGRYY